jgi:hypothetical protein
LTHDLTRPPAGIVALLRERYSATRLGRVRELLQRFSVR